MDTEKNPRWDLPKQQYLVENGEIGDCFPCCVAAIVDVARVEVPHWLRDMPTKYMQAECQNWLLSIGWVMVHIEHAEITFPRLHNQKDMKFIPIIACGPTVRSKKRGEHHAVVILEDTVVYDPHPSEAGLLYEVDHYLLVRSRGY